MLRSSVITVSSVRAYVLKHKLLVLLLSVVVLLVGLFGVYKFSTYSNQFTKEDYETLSEQARTVFATTGMQNVQESKTCDYSATGVYENHRLFCGVKQIAYAEYVNDAQAKELALRFYNAITSVFPAQLTDFSSFQVGNDRPTATSTISLHAPYPSNQYSFTIHTEQSAKRVYDFPERSEDNLIALSFYCYGKSRAQYYPLEET